MNDLEQAITEFNKQPLRNAVDILIVTYILYRLFMLIRGSRAWRIVLGIAGFVLLLFISGKLELLALNWLLDKATILGPVALVILFLPELRQAIEGLGRLRFGKLQIAPKFNNAATKTEARTVEEIVAGVAELASESTGALIVIERGAPLDEIAGNGVMVNATVSAPLLGSIFYEGNPLHDGAAIIRGDKIIAAACRLPLSDSNRLSQNVHMRHRAGLGVSEQLDCIAIIVSEERGTISYAKEGRLRKLTNAHELRDFLNRELRGEGLGQATDRTRRRIIRRGGEA
ncbi:MAG: TIGR00159 family protein [Fimbriimonadaceae bacterium]|nr:TIGR00159 family protein [Fimbriimonadaceae bacterium]